MEQCNCDDLTSLELYFHLIDIKAIPFEEKYEDWRFLKEEMIRICKENVKN